jgi:hypothetical protein
MLSPFWAAADGGSPPLALAGIFGGLAAALIGAGMLARKAGAA